MAERKQLKVSLPIPGVTKAIKDSNSWPGPTDNVEGTINEFSTEDRRVRFHVDYLLNQVTDFARSNMYVIKFRTNSDISGGFLIDHNEIISMTAKAVSIPAFNIGKLEIKRMGERLFIPTKQDLGEIQMTILCDDNMSQRKFLQSWMKHLVYDTDYNYYKKLDTVYSNTIEILQLDGNYNVVWGYEYNKVWPTSIGEIQYSHDSDTQITEFPATFCFSQCKVISNETDEFTIKGQ